MKNLINKIRNHFNKCTHEHITKIYVYDTIWDQHFDNDDFDDIPTILVVYYCEDCGKILIKDHISGGSWYPVSDKIDYKKFEQITGKKIKDMTLYEGQTIETTQEKSI